MPVAAQTMCCRELNGDVQGSKLNRRQLNVSRGVVGLACRSLKEGALIDGAVRITSWHLEVVGGSCGWVMSLAFGGLARFPRLVSKLAVVDATRPRDPRRVTA